MTTSTTSTTQTTSTTSSCCDDFARLSRRSFLGGTAALLGATTIVGSAAITTSAAALTPAPSVLVVLSLRGAADGLSLVVPHADPVYYDARPSIAVPSDRLLAKDGMFGLHPELAPLLPLWNVGRLAAVHATGLPAPNRSHFSAMEEVEDADPGSTIRSGWLNRLVGTDASSSPLQGFNVGGGVVPTSLYGDQPVMSADDVDSVQIPGDDKWDTTKGRRASLHTLWDGDRSRLGTAMRSMFGALDDFAPARRTADNRKSYPDSDLGRALSEVARVIRGNVGVEVITVDQGNWDMHSDMGTADGGWLNRNARDLATSVAAFLADLGDQASKVTLLTISEFGRRTVENASQGLDHGYGNVMFLAGAGVRGGKYYGRWAGLTDDLDGDVLVTTDYRSVLSEVVRARFGASTASVFPGFAPEPVGVMTSL
jgi:uncharacterized protein (DUF1501 family)